MPLKKMKDARQALRRVPAQRLPDPTKIVEGEFKKSNKTRIRIMEAAIDCLAETGYAGTTTTSVAARANLTRPAMLYHFPSRLALIQATIYYVFRKRIDNWNVSTTENVPHEQYFATAIERMLPSLHSREFFAFSELLTASRTDHELATVFTPALFEFDRARRENTVHRLPPDIVTAPWFDLVWDLARFLTEGLKQQGGLSFSAERRTAHMIELIKSLATTKEGIQLLEKVTAPDKARSR